MKKHVKVGTFKCGAHGNNSGDGTYQAFGIFGDETTNEGIFSRLL